jgi:hypothetical protein
MFLPTSGCQASMNEPLYREGRNGIAGREVGVAELTRKLKKVMPAGECQGLPLRKNPPKPALEVMRRKSGGARSRWRRVPPAGSAPHCDHAQPTDSRPHRRGPGVGTGTSEQCYTKTARQARKLIARLGPWTGRGAPARARTVSQVGRVRDPLPSWDACQVHSPSRYRFGTERPTGARGRELPARRPRPRPSQRHTPCLR